MLDAEKVDKVIVASHDWGSAMAQRVYLFHPERCIGLVNFNVTYRGKPTLPLTIIQMLKYH